MAKRRIENFQDYDRVKSERTAELEQRVSSCLGEIFSRERSQLQKDFSMVKTAVDMLRHPQQWHLAVQGDGKESAKLLQRLYPRNYYLQAQEEALLGNIRENINDLLRCGVRLARHGKGFLEEDNQRKFYARFLDECSELLATPTGQRLGQEHPQLGELCRRLQLPSEEQLEQWEGILHALRQLKAVTRQNAESIVWLLSPQTTVTGAEASQPAGFQPPSRAGSSPGSSRVPAFSSLPGTQPAAVTGTAPTQDGLGSYSTDSTDSKKEMENLKEQLLSIVGGKYGTRLCRAAPLETYQQERVLTKYVSAVAAIQREIEGRKDPDMERSFGIAHNFRRYTTLDGVLALKRQLFTALYGVPLEDDKKGTAGFDLEAYKDLLLQHAGLEVEVVRAYTEGKNATFRGESKHAPRRHWKNNAAGKIGRELQERFDAQGDGMFDELVKLGAVVKYRSSKDLFYFTTDLGNIKNPYLQEYIRITIFYDRIISQKKEVRPLISFNGGQKQP